MVNECYFCGDADSLINMDHNSLIINSVYIDFAQLIYELMQTKIDNEDPRLICTGCKNHLAQFFLMKQQASKHMKPDEVRKLEIVSLVSTFLDSNAVDCIVTKHSNLLAIHPDTGNSLFEEQLASCNNFLDSESQDDLIEENYTVVDVKEAFDFEISPSEEPEVVHEEDLGSFVEPLEISRVSKFEPKPKTVTKTEQWSCEVCARKFPSENALKIHFRTHKAGQIEGKMAMKNISTDESSFIGQKLWISQQLESQKQFEESTEGVKAVWNCSHCQFVTNNRSRFRMHLQKNHTEIIIRGPSKHSCFDCKLRFDGVSHLIVHNNCHRIFDLIAPYAVYPECTECKRFFTTNDGKILHDLAIHNLFSSSQKSHALRDPLPCIGVVHRNGEPFITDEEDSSDNFDEHSPTCGHCLVKFATENECKHHLMLHHATSFTCPFDSRVFSGIPTLSFGNHLRQCHPEVFPELEISCSFCKMLFETVYDKLAHMKVCKAKAFQCDHCDRSFFRKSFLLHHLKVVTGLMVFACHLCAKRCKDRGDLKTHIRSHTNVRPYPCPHCEKAYKTSSARASHVESHMDQTHACNICNVKFRRRILYQRHMKLLHDESYRQKCFAENTCKICSKSYLRKTHFKNHLKTHNSS